MPSVEELSHPTAPNGPSDVRSWVGSFGVTLPDNARLHPETIEGVRAIIGRVAGIRPLPDGFDVFCVLNGDCPQEAQADADGLIARILGSLALPPVALRYCELISPADLAPMGREPSLRLVQRS
jgi:hypothetical protein